MSAPSVLSTSPANNAVDQALNTTIQVEFDIAILANTAIPGNVIVINETTKTEVDGSVTLSSDSKTLTFIPNKAFTEVTLFRVFLIGSDYGSPSMIRSSDGTALAASYTFKFRTGSDQYVPLSEVATRGDVDGIGPIRAVESTLPYSLRPGLSPTATPQLVSSSPVSFRSNVDVSQSTITITFDLPISSSGIDTNTNFDAHQLFDLDAWYVSPDGDGNLWPQVALSQVPSTVTAPSYVQPTGTVSISGNSVVWTKAVGEPNFLYNSEILFTIYAGTPADNGTTLQSDTVVVFTTEMYPLFAPVRLIRTHLGHLSRNFLDDAIARVAHYWSIDALDQAAWKFYINDPYPNVRRYVIASTVISLLDDLMTELSLKGGGSKTLGDLQIQYADPAAIGNTPYYKRAVQDRDVSLNELRMYRGHHDPRYFEIGSLSRDLTGLSRHLDSPSQDQIMRGIIHPEERREFARQGSGPINLYAYQRTSPSTAGMFQITRST